MLDKSTLRAQLIKERSQITTQTWEDWSGRITQRVLKNKAVELAQFIHCYVSMNSRNEVNTHRLIQCCLDNNKKVFIPVMSQETNELKHASVSDLDKLVPNKWGVPEPLNQVTYSTISPDIIIVPMLAVDRKGNRIGYGKGYYDRFLQSVSAIKIGVIFDQFILDSVPVEPHDIPLDIIITETATINVKPVYF